MRHTIAKLFGRHTSDPTPHPAPEPEPAPTPVQDGIRKPKKGGFADLIMDNMKIVVTIAILAVIVGLVILFINLFGGQAEEQAESITGGTATYSADCSGQIVGRIGIVVNLGTAANDAIVIPFLPNDSGYAQPTTAFVAPAAANNPAAAGGGNPARGRLEINGTTGDVAFLRTVDTLSETAYNTDFNNNGEIDTGEVVALITVMAAEAEGTGGANDGTDPAPNPAPNILVADPDVNVGNVLAGSEIVVNRARACWGVRV